MIEINKTYNMDCEKLLELMVNQGLTVNLTVTSPPYDNLRTYNNQEDSWSFDKFKRICKLLYDVTSDGGIVVWVIGDATINGSETGSSFRQALHFMDVGFKLHDTMIYEKNSSTFPASRNSKRYTQIFEYMFVFVKGKIRKDISLIADKKNKWFGYTSWGNQIIYDTDGNKVDKGKTKTVQEFSLRNNIWKYVTGFNKNKVKHPAVFPFKLAEDHILSWSVENDVVFDPFMGSGTTIVAAIKNKRRYLGCECNEEYFNGSNEWIEETLKSNNTQLSLF